MKTLLASLFVLLLCSFTLVQSEIDGKWKGEYQGETGMETFYANYTVDGDTISGSLESAAGSIEFSDGTVDGNTFSYTFDFGGYPMTHTGSVSGDDLELMWEIEGTTGIIPMTRVK